MGYQRGQVALNWDFIGRRMTRLSHLTLRNFLIALHDLLATAAALFAAFYLRFEGDDGFFDRYGAAGAGRTWQTEHGPAAWALHARAQSDARGPAAG